MMPSARSPLSVLRAARVGLVAALLTLGLAGAGATDAAAQGANPLLVTQMQRDDGTWVQLSPRRAGFQLFGEADLAGTSMRMAGGTGTSLVNTGFTQFNAGGLCSYGQVAGDDLNARCIGAYVHIQALWGVPISEYRKIREVWPDVAMMQPPIGYSTPWRVTGLAPQVRRIGPADGQLGTYFSGVSEEVGGGCRDQTGLRDRVPPNFMLTALSDCPTTWPSGGFGGLRAVHDAVWRERFQQNPTAFRWDDWRIPAEQLGGTHVGDLATYGAFSDYNRETLALYGGVTPRGHGGPPRERGFPLGIEVRYDAFKFDRPSVRDGVFVRWLVINNSERVWGRGINYDSLYMGIDPSNFTNGVNYDDVAHGTHVMAAGGLSGRCSNTFPRRRLPGVTTQCGSSRSSFDIIMVLKSPIGDLRNKQFSDPESPFYSPSHPEADDTITYSHWRQGGFGAQDQLSWRRNDRSLFGLMSGIEALWLDGRDPPSFSASQMWNLFQWEGTDGTNAPANVRYNRSVPGSVPGYGRWDWNDDGIQDTLMLPPCGVAGCSALFSDTIAGGYGPPNIQEVGNYLGVGPFPLRAGDTTAFYWYVGASRDTTTYRRLVRNVTELYLSNFVGAGAPAAPVLAPSDVQVTPASARDTLPTTEVRVRFRMPAREDDPYLKRALALRESTDPVATELRRLNPTLVATVRGRMSQNLARVFAFKSCDDGETWTAASGTCESAAGARTENIGGSPIGPGWQAFRTFAADSVTGTLTSYTLTDVVQPGREYLYSFVTQSRALADIRVVVQQTMDASGTVTSQSIGTLADALGIDIDSVIGPLLVVGPSAVQVYAPLSFPAGTITARVDTVRTQSPAVTNRVSIAVRRANISGAYRMRFGNRFVITRTEDTVNAARTSRVIRQSVYARAAASPTDIVTIDFVASADTFTTTGDFTYSAPGTAQLSALPRSIAGTVKTFVDTIRSAGYVVSEGAGSARPLYVAVSAPNNFTFTALTQATMLYEGALRYPGFNATVMAEPAPPATRLARVIRDASRADTLPAAAVDTAGVIFRTATTASTNFGPGGFYKLKWHGDAHGIRNGRFFRYKLPVELQADVDAALAARPVARTTILDVSRALPNFPGGQFGTRTLIAAKLPFEIIGVNGQSADAVMFQRHTSGNAMDSIVRNSRLWGNGGDTVRVQIPPDVWMPGDTLWVIENIVTDSTITLAGNVVHVVRDTVVNGRTQRLPIQVTRRIVGLRMTLSCAAGGVPSRITCNPLEPGTTGATAYLPYDAGYESVWHLNRPFDQNSDVALTANALVTGATPLTKAQLNAIHVVPNPFIVESAYGRQQADGTVEPRILFVNVPPEGVLRIYTVSGQFVQQLSWTAGDLVTRGDNSPNGDLPYNLKTRAGRDLAAGLYIYVLTARGANSNGAVARGKFVLIR